MKLSKLGIIVLYFRQKTVNNFVVNSCLAGLQHLKTARYAV